MCTCVYVYAGNFREPREFRDFFCEGGFTFGKTFIIIVI